MFGRKQRKTPFTREQDAALEDLRDDCIALFINSGLTQKQLHERGGPTPQTTSKWLYKETQFPRYSTIESFAYACGYGLTLAPLTAIARAHEQPIARRLGLDIALAGRPRMPAKKRKVRS